MAYSSSIRRAQVVKLCELCQEDSIKWICIDCDKCLCEKCKTIHLRVPVTARHQIIPIGTSHEEIPRKIITDNIPCNDHPKKMACLFCRSCDSLICPDCVSSSHKTHNFDSIQLVLDEKRDHLRSIHGKINENLKSCESRTSEIKNVESKCNAIFDKSITDIKHKEQELINAIRKHSKKLQEDIEIERSEVNRILSEKEQEANHMKKNLKDQSETTEATLSSNQGSTIFKTTSKMEDLPVDSFDSLPSKVNQFVPGTESRKTIESLFGATNKMSISTDVLLKVDVEVIKTFTFDLPYINHIITLDEKSAWIACDKNVIKKVIIKENNMSISKTIPLIINGMALIHKTDILVSVEGTSDVKLIKESGKIENFLTVAPLRPHGIHVTKDEVIVGVKESGDNYTPTDKSQRALFVFDMTGIKKHVYQYGENGERLFTLPRRLTTNKNMDILVIDKLSQYSGRVVALNQEGKLRWAYERHSKINDSKTFDPRDTATTTEGYIVVSDLKNQALYVLSESGEVLTCTTTKDLNIILPCGLDIDDKQRLWVGCATGGKKTGAKIHIIKLHF